MNFIKQLFTYNGYQHFDTEHFVWVKGEDGKPVLVARSKEATWPR